MEKPKTHGHELRGGEFGWEGGAGWRGLKGNKWGNCNSIINTIYFFKKAKNKNES